MSVLFRASACLTKQEKYFTRNPSLDLNAVRKWTLFYDRAIFVLEPAANSHFFKQKQFCSFPDGLLKSIVYGRHTKHCS